MRKMVFFLLGILSVNILVYFLFKEQERVSMKPMKPLRCDGGMNG